MQGVWCPVGAAGLTGAASGRLGHADGSALFGQAVDTVDDFDHVDQVDFDEDDGRYIYEIRLLQNDGRMAKLKVDAVDGKVLEVRRKEKTKDRDAHPHR